MAKKIKNKKIIKVNKKVKKRAVKLKRHSLLLFFLIILVFGVGIRFVILSSKNKIVSFPSKSVSQVKAPVKKAALITPYPTVKTTPTPVPLTGFCLRVPILTYHHIQPETVAKELKQTSLTVDNGIFEQQMSQLVASGYTPIFANELINSLITHSVLPGKPIMVTMDDGYADNYNYALPVLKKYNIKANLMLASGLVGSNPDMLTWDEVREMKSSGLFYFTNHTWSHSSLIRISQGKIENEIDTAKIQIEQYTGQNVNIFTYPYGEFNNNAVQTLQRKGYVGAFTTIPGVYQCDSFIMTLHRYHIGNASLSAYGI